MNTSTGEIGPYEQLLDNAAQRLVRRGASMVDAKRIAQGYLKLINPANLSISIRQQLENQGRAMISRNSPCPCGSGKRFKRCCMTRGVL